MRITILTIGSRGDVQPYIALGMGLQAAGHEVRVATHRPFEHFIRSHGLDFAPVEGNPQELLMTEGGQSWLESSRNPAKFMKRMRDLTEPLIHSVLNDTEAAVQGADLALASVLGTFSMWHIAEKVGIPCYGAYLQHAHPTAEVGSILFPPISPALPTAFQRAYNRFTFSMTEQSFQWMFGKAVGEMRAELYGLPPMDMHGLFERMSNTPRLSLYGFSQHFIPRAPEWPKDVHVTGFWTLPVPEDFTPPAGLVDFLESGPPPVYIGFGSMANRDPERTARTVLEALDRSKQRGILLTGWGAIGEIDLPDTVYRIDNIPHEWLFPRMAAVVHHGGIGTTAAGLRAGVPSIIVPFFADQPFNAARVVALGAGPKSIPHKHLSVQALSSAITQAVTDKAMRAHAVDLGRRLQAEDGVANAVAAFERYTEQNGLKRAVMA